MNVTSTTQKNYTQSSNKSHRTEQNVDTAYKQNEASVTQNSDTKSNQNKSPSIIKDFLNDLSSNESTSFKSSVIKNEIENKVNKYAQLIMDERGTATESELENSKLLNTYKKELLQEYKISIENSTDMLMSAEQEAIIKVLMKENTQETSSLEALLATKNTTVEETQATGRMAEMQEKYKDAYTPIPDTYTKGSEELQMQKIYEAYPNYISGPEFLQLVDSFFEGTKIQLGQKLTEAEETQQKLDYDNAFAKAYEQVGGKDAWKEMVKGSFAIMDKYPVNNYGKYAGVTNAKELARYENAMVYEGLESGKTLEESKSNAKMSLGQFLDPTVLTYQYRGALLGIDALDALKMPDGSELVPPERHAPVVDFNSVFNSTMDLREYGIEGDWEFYEIPENQKDMITEIEKKIDQFNFMLNNESKIKEAYMKLNPDYQTLGNNEGYQRMINEDYMPKMQEALNIFKNYKIYD